MHALGNARVDARAGDRQAVTPAAVDEVERLRFAVPEIFCVKEPFVVRAEVFEKIVARADGDAGHRGVGIARDAVGDLIDRAVAAAGIEPHLFSALGKTRASVAAWPTDAVSIHCTSRPCFSRSASAIV